MALTGTLFSSPCATPVLVAILAVVFTSRSLIFGVLMLFLYSLGHSILLIIAATSIGFENQLSSSKKFEKISKIIKIFLGFAMVMLVGIYSIKLLVNIQKKIVIIILKLEQL